MVPCFLVQRLVPCQKMVKDKFPAKLPPGGASDPCMAASKKLQRLGQVLLARLYQCVRVSNIVVNIVDFFFWGKKIRVVFLKP